MNSLVLMSLDISEFFDSLNFTINYIDYFMLISIFVVSIFINKKSALNKNNTPEVLLCNELGVELLWGIGGEEKVESSSDLITKTRDFEAPPIRVKPHHSGR